MSLLNKSMYAYDPNDIIDLDHAFNEESSQMISLSSIDDYQLNELTRSLVTPTPNKHQSPSPYPESVLLFRNLKHDKTTEDLVHSDLKDFIGNYDMDDLISRPGSRIPSRTTFNPRQEALLKRRTPTSVNRHLQQEKSSLPHSNQKITSTHPSHPPPPLTNQDKTSQLLSALEQSYHREQQMEQVYLNQLKEIDAKVYEKLKKDSEALMKRRSSLLEQFRANTISCDPNRYTPNKTRSSENSTTTTSSNSGDLYYDPPPKQKPVDDDVYPQDSVSHGSPTNKSRIRSNSTEDKKMECNLNQPRRSSEQESKTGINAYLTRSRRNTTVEPKRNNEERTKSDRAIALSYLTRGQKRNEQEQAKEGVSGLNRLKSIQEVKGNRSFYLRRDSKEERPMTKDIRYSYPSRIKKEEEVKNKPVKRNSIEPKEDTIRQRYFMSRNKESTVQERRLSQLNNNEEVKRQISYKSKRNSVQQDSQDTFTKRKSTSEDVKESARRVLAMVQENRMKRLGNNRYETRKSFI
ncbi:hypothetical protein G6F46_003117 [Rhizopus delemar]|uniref:Uncharacterized protein n=3 Tax=Rhizopus TaxID=4842 RepID=I1C637_RHIO9|nr:hypothetical protein RO3G_08622 [Rhizopus delemar RA 99-880]KAG1462061.1 hypothetical protein G6F55_003193 [Rhizopus delemar]KAG1550585.1 hypothetical protein G6F51_002352 [Rhizopus arrhizus]KAG1493250.1 hypothetical protein G6F54_008714 [Rhizopus delemar]KAG1507297.1 hypothetical protein G6F53_009057 [Rhizopus delemar]|eukprot:EIE83917.1 hypothetical protein RO3G_08622 [Rhizopus delemar RA 99-880]